MSRPQNIANRGSAIPDRPGLVPPPWILVARITLGPLSAGLSCKDDGDHQADAAPPAGCVLGEFDCGTGTECIDAAAVCDGASDCSNDRDEESCSCGAGLYTCRDGQCIHAAFVCDYVENCLDGSDEESCP